MGDYDYAYNTSAFGAAPGVYGVLEELAKSDVSGYPSSFTKKRPGPLVARLAKDYGVDPSQVVVGLGGEEILKHATRFAMRPGEVLALGDVTWPHYRKMARRVQARVVPYLVDEIDTGAVTGVGEFAVNVDELCRLPRHHHVRLLIITSPANPTGDMFPVDRLDEVLDAFRGALVISDEAYDGLADYSRSLWSVAMQGMTERHPQLLRVRSWSKGAGMAKLRVGAGIGGVGWEGLFELFEHYLGFPEYLEEAGVAALDDVQHQQSVRSAYVAARQGLYDALPAMGIRVFRSQANFILVRFPDRMIPAIRRAFDSAGIVVKWLDGKLTGCARITVGTPEQSTFLLYVLGQAFVTASTESRRNATTRTELQLRALEMDGAQVVHGVVS